MNGNGKILMQNFLYSLNPKLRAKAFRDIELLKQLGTDYNNKFVLLQGGRDSHFVSKPT